MFSVFYEAPPPEEPEGPDLPFRMWPFLAAPLACSGLTLLYDLVNGLSEHNPVGTLVARVLVAALGGLLLAGSYATISFIYVVFFRR